MAEEGADAMSEEDMAAAMEAMGEESAGQDEAMSEDAMAAAMGADGETLSQDEIDNLLGFGGGAELATTGVQALLDHSQENYERLPMLEVVFDRFVRSLSTSLRNLTGENVEVNIDSITSLRFEDYMNSIPLPALLGIFQAIEWENFGLITVDSALTYSMVDILLGGGRAARPIRIEGRPFTTIEQDIIKNLCRSMLEEMSNAFNPLTPATFRMDRLETNPRFATITRPSNAVVLVSLRIDMEDRGGIAHIMIPYVTLEPIKELLTQMFSGESFGSDISWEEHLSEEVRNTVVEVEAVLAPKTITLKELAQLREGDTLMMHNTPSDDLDILCKDIKLISGKLGASEKNLAIAVSGLFSKGISKIL